MASIAERGIEEPLEGVDTPGARLLLNGFKRYRWGKKLGIDSVPYIALAQAGETLSLTNSCGRLKTQQQFSTMRAA